MASDDAAALRDASTTQHREEIFGFLVRRLGREIGRGRIPGDVPARASRVPKLRAPRAPARLGVHDRRPDRIDEHRRPRCAAELPELATHDGRRHSRELEHLADELPPTERAAVVLRYGYDLDYADIGAALGSNADRRPAGRVRRHPPVAKKELA